MFAAKQADLNNFELLSAKQKLENDPEA